MNQKAHHTFFPSPVIGIDEVGRGCLAGPVYAAAVILDDQNIPNGLNDSKLLSASRREELSKEIKACSKWAIGFATVEEIDEINIFQASFLAMSRAISNLGVSLGHILVDGKFPIPQKFLQGSFKQTPVIKGDQIYLPISAASILAKVERDLEMVKLDELFPQYGFARHKGYGTEFHRKILSQYGPLPLHRKTFKVKAFQ